MNMNNFAVLSGRLTANPVKFDNKDGSMKVKFTLAVEDNYSTNGDKKSQMIPVESFVKAGVDYTKTPYAALGKGDKIRVQTSLRDNNYTDAAGKKVYGMIVMIESLQFEESKAVTDARHAANVAAAATVPVVAAPVPAQA